MCHSRLHPEAALAQAHATLQDSPADDGEDTSSPPESLSSRGSRSIKVDAPMHVNNCIMHIASSFTYCTSCDPNHQQATISSDRHARKQQLRHALKQHHAPAQLFNLSPTHADMCSDISLYL